MNIVATDGYTLNPGDNPWDAIADMGNLTVYDRTDPSQLMDRIEAAEIVLVNKTEIRRQAIEQLPKLKFISVTATGYDIVDIDAAGERGVFVSNVPIYATETVAQYVFALILEMARQVGLHDSAVKRGEWAAQPDWSFWKKPLFELAERSIGIIGFGRIGRRVGELAHAFKMRVAAYDPFPANPPSYAPFSWLPIERIFSESDFISINCNQTPENERFVNRNLIGRMKKSAFLINTSRGGLIDEHDLAEALENGQIAGAALDVVSEEPIRPDNPLLKAKNILLTPHVAWATRAARRRLMGETAENVRAFIAGTPKNVVNRDAIRR
ncbi:MAG: D-2-hydroxyacid dehydrogenase [Desulfobacteraceae bacterium]|nr:MAG: D-2-hydroxyacid dehydrogenase [Desulfobacteraceae bacterium]